MDSLFLDLKKKKAKGAHEPKAQTNGAYPGFHEVCLEVSQGYPPPPSSCGVSSVSIYTPGWRETKWSEVPCLRKVRDGRDLNPDLQIRSSRC